MMPHWVVMSDATIWSITYEHNWWTLAKAKVKVRLRLWLVYNQESLTMINANFEKFIVNATYQIETYGNVTSWSGFLNLKVYV